MVLQWERASTYKTPSGRWTAIIIIIIIIISARFRNGSLSRNCHKVGHSYAGKRILLLLLLLLLLSWIVKYDCCVPSLIETCILSSGYRLPHPPPFSRPTKRIVAGPNVHPSIRPVPFRSREPYERVAVAASVAVRPRRVHDRVPTHYYFHKPYTVFIYCKTSL